MDSPSQNNETSESTKRSAEVLELIADWVKLYAGNYGKEPTEETGLAYRIGLSDLKTKLLHKAFMRCLRECTFWPTVAEVRTAYAVESEKAAPRYQLPAVDDYMTPEEGKEFCDEIRKTLANTPQTEWLKPIPPEPRPGPILLRTPESDARTKEQIEQLKKKYPEAFKERSA